MAGGALRCCVKKGVGKGLTRQDAQCAGWGGSGRVEGGVKSRVPRARWLGLTLGPNLLGVLEQVSSPLCACFHLDSKRSGRFAGLPTPLGVL